MQPCTTSSRGKIRLYICSNNWLQNSSQTHPAVKPNGQCHIQINRQGSHSARILTVQKNRRRAHKSLAILRVSGYLRLRGAWLCLGRSQWVPFAPRPQTTRVGVPTSQRTHSIFGNSPNRPTYLVKILLLLGHQSERPILAPLRLKLPRHASRRSVLMYPKSCSVVWILTCLRLYVVPGTNSRD